MAFKVLSGLLGIVTVMFLYVTSETGTRLSSNQQSKNTEATPTLSVLERVLEDLQNTINALQQQNVHLQRQVNSLHAKLTSKLSHGVEGPTTVFTHWGRRDCLGTSATPIYSGYTAGPPYGHGESAMCLPEHPSWEYYKDGYGYEGGVIGAMLYQLNANLSENAFGRDISNSMIPCSVCQAQRSVHVMIPGMSSCITDWTLEYKGYLMGAASFGDTGANYVCVDQNAQAIPYTGNLTVNGEGLYMVEVRCGFLPCDDFPDGREMACVMCTK